MTNVDQKLKSYRDRAHRLETERRDAAEAIRDLRKEMLGAGVSKTEVAGVLLAVKREFESADRKAARTAAEEVADMLGASGSAPLFGVAA